MDVFFRVISACVGSHAQASNIWVVAVKFMSKVLVPSTTLRAPASASSLWVTPVWDLSLLMYVVYPR